MSRSQNDAIQAWFIAHRYQLTKVDQLEVHLARYKIEEIT